MTVAATTNRKTYTGDNVSTSFDTSPVIFYLSSNLQVRVTVIATGVSTLLTENTHYTVSGGSASGATGAVNLAGGSSPHGALLSTEKLVILRVLPLTQASDFVNNSNSDAEVLEAALDKLTDVDQQIQEQADRAIRFASGDVSGSVTEIPDVTTRAGRLLGFDATGLLTTFIVQAGTSIVDLAASTGSALIGFIQAGTGAVLRSLQSKLRDRVSVFDFMTAAQIADYQAGTSTLDMALPFQAAATASLNIYFPPTAGCKCTAAVAMQSGGKAYGAGKYATRINFWGSDGFTFATASGGNTVQDMALYGYTAGGAADAKTKKGIALNGTSGSHIVDCFISNLYLRGWSDGIYCAYVNQSTFSAIVTLTCTNGIHSFGQCLNNDICNGCVLVVSGGNASVKLEKDVAVRPEGWTIINSVLYGGTFGITSDGVLSLRVAHCVIDGVTDKGLDLTNPQNSSIIGNWISAANFGVNFNDLGSPVNINNKVIGNDILCSAQNAKNIYVGNNVSGVKVLGNDLIGTGSGGLERLVYVNGSGVLVKDNDFTKASANSSVFFVGANCICGDNTGSNSVVYNAGVSDPTQTVTGATYSVLATDTAVIANRAGTITLTLLDATVSNRKRLLVRTIQAQTVVSASGNVVPLAGGAAGTAILAATAGKWAELQSDGTNWQIMASN